MIAFPTIQQHSSTQHPIFAFEMFPPSTLRPTAQLQTNQTLSTTTRARSPAPFVSHFVFQNVILGSDCRKAGEFVILASGKKEAFDSINFIDFPQLEFGRKCEKKILKEILKFNRIEWNEMKMFVRPSCFSNRFLIVVLIFCISFLYFAYNFHWCLLLSIQRTWLKVRAFH